MENSSAKRKKLFVISGPSGVGKGTVIEGFLKRNPEFKLSISYTTRAKREGEVEGVNYFFRTREEFVKGIENDEFLEWAEFSDNLYGTKRVFIEKCLNNQMDLILEIDTQGALQVKEKMPKAVLIFIAPPSFEDLEYRLRNRKTESEEAILKRLEFVKTEIKNSAKFDYIVINDEIARAIGELEKIINAERAN
ncbi:MAG TPA: guanylate kinase [Candidatus Gastranaerophilaceae bacterium]|nr:guanylate kinase [Candidatus Gastranaerophilaceae bacterium]